MSAKHAAPRERLGALGALGALDAATLHYEDADGTTHARPVQADAVPDALSLLTLMERYDLRQLWVHPAFIAARRIERWPAGTFFRLAGMTGWTCSEGDMARWMICFHTGTYGARHLVVPGLEDRCDWRTAADGRELLRAVQLYRDALGGMAYRRSPGATGTNLMRALHQGPRATELEAPVHIPPPARAAGTEAPWQWIRPLTSEECARHYLHAYDRNGAYLAACSALALGVGTAEHLDDMHDAWDLLTQGKPGYWRLAAPTEPAARLVPDVYAAHRRDPAGGVWMTTPAARLLMERGNVQTPILEAWAWRDSARYLEPWYKVLRDGRRVLMEHADTAPARIALDALKATYAHSIGWLDGGWEREAAQDGHAGVLYRPDWRHAIIATANANLMRRVLKAADAQPDFVPFAINHDCIYVASDTPDAAHAFPAEAIKLGRNLGEWKIVHNGVPLARLADVLTTNEPPKLSTFLAALRRVAHGEGVAHASV